MSNIPPPSHTIKQLSTGFYKGIKTTLMDKITSPKFLIIIVLIGIFVSLALFVYNKYVAPRLNPDFVPNKEFIDTGKHDGIDNAILYYFRADWCPISKKTDPIISELEEFYKQNPIENVDFKVLIINGENDETEMDKFEKKYDVRIDGYPSIYLVKNDKIIEYNAKPDLSTLKEFINTAL